MIGNEDGPVTSDTINPSMSFWLSIAKMVYTKIHITIIYLDNFISKFLNHQTNTLLLKLLNSIQQQSLAQLQFLFPDCYIQVREANFMQSICTCLYFSWQSNKLFHLIFSYLHTNIPQNLLDILSIYIQNKT